MNEAVATQSFWTVFPERNLEAGVGGAGDED
jgi:hypothetical protein